MNTRISKAKPHLERLVLVVGTIMLPATAMAYIGPGAGLSVIGSVLAFLAAIIVAIFGFLFFPIRRMLRKRKQRAAAKEPPAGARTAGDPDRSEPGGPGAPATDRDEK